MPQPNKIPLAFAASGDKNVIPESTETTGLASWRDGFPAITSTPFSEGGIAPKRADFNGIFNALSLATLWQQQGGFYAYDNATDYEVGNVVEYNNDLYKCITANGPSSSIKAPTDATVWCKIMTAADAAVYATYETGIWTPTLSGASTAGVFTYSKQTGYYVKMNNLVYITAEINISDVTTYPSGTARVGGLPFATRDVRETYMGFAYGINGADNSFNRIHHCHVGQNKTYFEIYMASNTNPGHVRYGTFSQSTGEYNLTLNSSNKTGAIYCELWYRTD